MGCKLVRGYICFFRKLSAFVCYFAFKAFDMIQLLCFQSPKRSVKLHDGSFGFAEVITIKVSAVDEMLSYYQKLQHNRSLPDTLLRDCEH